eukprot:scaffold2248_cov261-Pinguiococcus_pyrenoidosus.AAC.6
MEGNRRGNASPRAVLADEQQTPCIQCGTADEEEDAKHRLRIVDDPPVSEDEDPKHRKKRDREPNEGHDPHRHSDGRVHRHIRALSGRRWRLSATICRLLFGQLDVDDAFGVALLDLVVVVAESTVLEDEVERYLGGASGEDGGDVWVRMEDLGHVIKCSDHFAGPEDAVPAVVDKLDLLDINIWRAVTKKVVVYRAAQAREAQALHRSGHVIRIRDGIATVSDREVRCLCVSLDGIVKQGGILQILLGELVVRRDRVVEPLRVRDHTAWRRESSGRREPVGVKGCVSDRPLHSAPEVVHPRRIVVVEADGHGAMEGQPSFAIDISAPALWPSRLAHSVALLVVQANDEVCVAVDHIEPSSSEHHRSEILAVSHERDDAHIGLPNALHIGCALRDGLWRRERVPKVQRELHLPGSRSDHKGFIR